MTNVPPDLLAVALRRSAAGDYGTEAAAGLLIAHRRWLHRPDFVEACIEVDDDGSAWISWAAIAAFLDAAGPASSSERRILALVAELAGVSTGRPLGYLLTSLDDTNAKIVADAFIHVLTLGGRR